MRPLFANSHFRQQTHLRVLAASSARVLSPASAFVKTRAQGRPGAGWHPRSVRHRNAHGVDHRCCRSPGLPCAMVLTCPSCSPRGAMHYCPRRPADDRCARPVGSPASPQDLTHRPRASGPHDLFVRARLRMHLRELACAHARSHAKTLPASCRRREAIAHGRSRPAMPLAPDAVASIATQPAVRADRDPPLVSGQGVSLVRQIRISVKWNILRNGA
ncbi:hypothetical protein ACVWYH_008486 [Bradyrhizobium sp. GM24.11]